MRICHELISCAYPKGKIKTFCDDKAKHSQYHKHSMENMAKCRCKASSIWWMLYALTHIERPQNENGSKIKWHSIRANCQSFSNHIMINKLWVVNVCLYVPRLHLHWTMWFFCLLLSSFQVNYTDISVCLFVLIYVGLHYFIIKSIVFIIFGRKWLLQSFDFCNSQKKKKREKNRWIKWIYDFDVIVWWFRHLTEIEMLPYNIIHNTLNDCFIFWPKISFFLLLKE